MSSITEISDTACVNLNDAIVWIAFGIFPSNYFEPFDKGTEEWLDVIDFDKWIFNNNMYDRTVYTSEICKKYNLPKNIVLDHIEKHKEEPYFPEVVHFQLKNDNIDKKERKKLKAELTEFTEYYNQKAEFDNALNELFEEAYPKLYSAINAGKIRIYGMKFTEDTEDKHISQISRQDLQFKLFDFKNLTLKTKSTGENYGFLMVNLKDLLTEFEPQEITSAKVLNIGGEYVVSKDNRFSYSGRNSSLASEQIALLGMYVCELLTKRT